MTLIRRDFLMLTAGAAALAGPLAVLRPRGAAAQDYATGEMALGPKDAPVTIIEYASMTCPHCANFHNDTFPALKEGYIDSGKVRFIYREFPLDRAAFFAAVLARCAGPARFFGFIEVLFQQQQNWARSDDPLAALARLGRLGGVGQERFEACLANQELGNAILVNRRDGNQKFGVDSTPTFIIAGKKYPGALGIAQLDNILKPLLGTD